MYATRSAGGLMEVLNEGEQPHPRTTPPEGESIRAMEERVLDHLHAVRKSYPWKTVVVVTHAEPIRAALLHAANLPLNEFARIDVLPGSINRLMLIERASSSRDFLKVLTG